MSIADGSREHNYSLSVLAVAACPVAASLVAMPSIASPVYKCGSGSIGLMLILSKALNGYLACPCCLPVPDQLVSTRQVDMGLAYLQSLDVRAE